MNVSIVMPLYNPDKVILKKVLNAIKKQKFNGKKEIIKVNEGWGLAKSINFGIKKAKYEIIVTIHQDCIPVSNKWLSTLVKPLENSEVVASISDVYDIENKIKYVPALDEKGDAYKKNALIEVGLFDSKIFLNSGEDSDMHLKLQKIGKIAYPHCLVKHDHKGYLIKKSKYKNSQNANTFGCLFRKWRFSLPKWWKGVIQANVFNPVYFYWFWRGFILGKQDFKR